MIKFIVETAHNQQTETADYYLCKGKKLQQWKCFSKSKLEKDSSIKLSMSKTTVMFQVDSGAEYHYPKQCIVESPNKCHDCYFERMNEIIRNFTFTLR